MVPIESIFIWEGKIQLGDEPGIYGDAAYSGIGIKLPLTLANIDPNAPQDDILKITLHTSDVNVYKGYPGHKIIVYSYAEDPANKSHWIETVIKNTDRITKDKFTIFEVPIRHFVGSDYISIGIEVDTTVAPGLYDDFLLLGINYEAIDKSIYVKFGFQ